MNKYRLSSNEYQRNEKIEEPKEIYFIAVEGNITEKEYFTWVKKYSSEIGIKAVINIEVLNRRIDDNHSAPDDVLKLLEECVEIRKEKEDKFFNRIVNELNIDKNLYSIEFIKQYANEEKEIDKNKKEEFEKFLNEHKFDLAYFCYLRKIKTKDEEKDKYCVVIDRDINTHTEEQIKRCIEKCKDKEYRLLLSTPCFEFWLWLHLVASEEIKKEDPDIIYKNEHISNRHTFVSKKVNNISNHNKHISEKTFKEFYLKNIINAISKSKDFETNNDNLLNDIGTSIGVFFEEIMINKQDIYS